MSDHFYDDWDGEAEYVQVILYKGRLYIEHQDGSHEPLCTDLFNRVIIDRRI